MHFVRFGKFLRGRKSMLEGKLTRSVIASEVGTRRSVRAGHVWTLAFLFMMTTAAGLHPAAAQEPATPAPPTPTQSSPEQAPPAANEDATSPGSAALPEVVVTTAPKSKTASKAKKTTKRAGTAQARAPQPAPPRPKLLSRSAVRLEPRPKRRRGLSMASSRPEPRPASRPTRL